MAVVRTSEDVLIQRAVCLIVAHDVALQAAADPHALAEERRVAKAHAGYCYDRLRRIDALVAQGRSAAG